MARFISLKTFSDKRGSLGVIEQEIPFRIKRIYYIYDVPGDEVRAGHRHRKNIQALICVRGSCRVFVNNGTTRETFLLDRPDLCLLMNPEDWHTMDRFSPDALLLVLASEQYDRNDYIDEEYP
ncbi:MAG: FdtA/QdtA family cupin domain-containing protein [Desulfuromonadaceae bacterium]